MFRPPVDIRIALLAAALSATACAALTPADRDALALRGAPPP